MNRPILTVFAACAALGLAVPALAQEKVSVSKRDCERVMKKNASVSATYQGGVDVRGKKVKGADINPSNLDLPKEITIDLGMDIAGKYGIGSGYDASPSVGTIKYDLGSGALTFNGKRLDNRDTTAITRACAKQYGQ